MLICWATTESTVDDAELSIEHAILIYTKGFYYSIFFNKLI